MFENRYSIAKQNIVILTCIDIFLHPYLQSEFYEATRILFVCKENKNNDFIQQFVSVSLRVTVAPFWRVSARRKLRSLFCVSRNSRIRFLHVFTLWFERKQHIRVARLTQNSVRSLCPATLLIGCRSSPMYVSIRTHFTQQDFESPTAPDI